MGLFCMAQHCPCDAKQSGVAQWGWQWRAKQKHRAAALQWLPATQAIKAADTSSRSSNTRVKRLWSPPKQ